MGKRMTSKQYAKMKQDWHDSDKTEGIIGAVTLNGNQIIELAELSGLKVEFDEESPYVENQQFNLWTILEYDNVVGAFLCGEPGWNEEKKEPEYKWNELKPDTEVFELQEVD